MLGVELGIYVDPTVKPEGDELYSETRRLTAPP